MSLKTADQETGGSRKSRRWWSSITFRLTLLYILSALGILTVCCVLVYWMLTRSVDHLDRQFLGDEVHDLRNALREFPKNPGAMDAEINSEGFYPNYYARIVGGQGRELAATPHMGEVTKNFQFPHPVKVTESPKQYIKTRTNDGRSFLLTSAWGRLGDTGDTQMVVEVALDVSKEQRLVRNFGQRLAGIVFLGLALSAAVSIVVTRMGMRPLTEITAATQRIGPTQLHERIGSPQW